MTPSFLLETETTFRKQEMNDPFFERRMEPYDLENFVLHIKKGFL